MDKLLITLPNGAKVVVEARYYLNSANADHAPALQAVKNILQKSTEILNIREIM